MDLLNVPLRWVGSHGLALEYGWVAAAWLLKLHGEPWLAFEYGWVTNLFLETYRSSNCVVLLVYF